MRLTVALLTCDRLELTRRTVDSLLAQNDTSNWNLIYGDDNSTDPRVIEYVESRGFRPIYQNRGDRIGCTPMTFQMYDRLLGKLDADAPVLYLQDDMESRRPVPLDVVSVIRQDAKIGWLRLALSARRKGRELKGLPRRQIGAEQVAVGYLTFSHQPHISSVELERSVLEGAWTEARVNRHLEHTELLVAALCTPVFVHRGKRKSVKGSRHGKPKHLRPEYIRRDGILS